MTKWQTFNYCAPPQHKFAKYQSAFSYSLVWYCMRSITGRFQIADVFVLASEPFIFAMRATAKTTKTTIIILMANGCSVLSCLHLNFNSFRKNNNIHNNHSERCLMYTFRDTSCLGEWHVHN